MDRKFFILWSLCLIIISFAIVYKLSKSNQPNQKLEPFPSNEVEILSTSESFYSSEEKEKVANEPIAKPISPISARAYLVGNVSTGEIYLQKGANSVLPVASMSKLITAIESIDQFSLSKKITINENIPTVPDSYKLNSGETFTVEELLYPLLLNSSNTTAEILASSVDRVKFMDLMSSYAWEIGMPSTFFADPTGLSPLNTSSANDFFALAKYLYKLRPEILAITKNANYNISTTTDHGGYEFKNTHPFAKEPNFIGGKTGRTPEARDTMLSILKIKNKPIAFIVLSSEDRRIDTLYLIGEAQKIIPD